MFRSTVGNVTVQPDRIAVTSMKVMATFQKVRVLIASPSVTPGMSGSEESRDRAGGLRIRPTPAHKMITPAVRPTMA